MAQDADPDPHPRVTDALAPPTSADPAPSAATTPSAAPPLLEPSEVQVRSPTRRAAQDSDRDAHLHVAEAPAPLPTAARLLSEAASPNSKFKFRFVYRGDGEHGSDPDARPRNREIPATPPFSTPMLPESMRCPRRGALVRARDPSSSSATIQTRSSTRLAAQQHPAKSLLYNDVVQDKSMKETMPREKLSVISNGENKDAYHLEKPNAGEKKNDQISSNLQLVMSQLSKISSDKVEQAMYTFTATMKEYSSDKLYLDKVDEATLNLAAKLKEIHNEQSRCLAAELSKELDNCAAVVKKVALIFDVRMLLHKPPNSKFFEKPSRLTSIMKYLQKKHLTDRCDLFNCDKATREQLLAVHTQSHVDDIESISSKDQDARDRMALEHSDKGDIYYSEGSGEAAFLAAGGAIKACSLVAERRYQYSFAIIRPPGHHAGLNGPEGFCLLNNAAIAAAHLLDHYQRERVLIVDWDYHHPNGTEEIFYGDKRVLVFSVHRYGETLYPHTGSVNHIGKGRGTGFNVNVGWPNPKIGDVDYLAVWEHVLLPLAEEFQPEIILISCGFDAAKGDKLGDCCVTPSGFASLLQMLMRFAPIAMILEGGYDLPTISKCTEACMKVLLGDNSVIARDTESLPYDTTWQAILKIRSLLRPFWKVFATEIPKAVYSRSIPWMEEGNPSKPEGSRHRGRNKKIG